MMSPKEYAENLLVLEEKALEKIRLEISIAMKQGLNSTEVTRSNSRFVFKAVKELRELGWDARAGVDPDFNYTYITWSKPKSKINLKPKSWWKFW